MIQRAALLCALTLSLAAFAAPPERIPLEVLFGPPVRSQPAISPDGKHLAWLAPDAKGIPNVWVAPAGSSDGRMVTNEKSPILSYDWAEDSAHILYLQDSDGDENAHLYSADLEGKNVRDLTPFRGVRAYSLYTSPRRPHEVLIGLNLEDRKVFDLYRIKLTTGAVTIECRDADVAKEPEVDVLSYTPDANLDVRAATTFDRKSGRTAVRVRDDAKSPWRELISWAFEETPVYFGQAYGSTMVLAFSPDGKTIDVISSAGSDTARVVRLDVKSRKQLAVVASHPRADPSESLEDVARPMFLVSPATKKLQAVAFEYLEPEWRFADDDFAKAYATLNRKLPGFLVLVSRDTADRKWIVAPRRADAPSTYYLYDRDKGTVTKLFDSRPELLRYERAPSEGVVIRSRDGLDLVTYVTYPPGVPRRNLPMVVWAHGGPWGRDQHVYVDLFQFFANRGYAVLAVNYRGSEGFGRRFVNAFTGQWGTGTHNDLLDAVRWAVDRGLADPKRIAIGGTSGGGYAALRALTETPDVFACGIDSAGPADVKMMVESFPPYWGPSRVRFLRRIGDVVNDEAFNRKISPLYHVEKIRVPLLIVQGANDPVVPLPTVERLVKTLREAGQQPEYVVYPDEGHGCCNHPKNMIDFAARMERFLGEHLSAPAARP